MIKVILLIFVIIPIIVSSLITIIGIIFYIISDKNVSLSKDEINDFNNYIKKYNKEK